jgi:hypothetical protein
LNKPAQTLPGIGVRFDESAGGELKSTNKRPQPPESRQKSESNAAAGHDSTAERRQTVRIPYHTSVKCYTPDGAVSGRIRDLSGKGLFVDIGKPFSVGERFELDFTFRSGKHSMKLRAEVVRQTYEGIAIRLLS